MKRKKSKHPKSLIPSKLALSATMITSLSTLLATTLALALDIPSFTPILQMIYGPMGYSLSTPGALLGTLYIAIDTFVIVYIFAWIYNKLL